MKPVRILDDDVEQLQEHLTNPRIKSLMITHKTMLKSWMTRIAEHAALVDPDEATRKNLKVYEDMVKFLGLRIKNWMSWLTSSEIGQLTRTTCNQIMSYSKVVIRQKVAFAR